MKTAGIVIDSWKLTIFSKHLTAARFAFTQHPGITPGTLLLKVETEDVETLHPIVQAANAAAPDSLLWTLTPTKQN